MRPHKKADTASCSDLIISATVLDYITQSDSNEVIIEAAPDWTLNENRLRLDENHLMTSDCARVA